MLTVERMAQLRREPAFFVGEEELAYVKSLCVRKAELALWRLLREMAEDEARADERATRNTLRAPRITCTEAAE